MNAIETQAQVQESPAPQVVSTACCCPGCCADDACTSSDGSPCC